MVARSSAWLAVLLAASPARAGDDGCLAAPRKSANDEHTAYRVALDRSLVGTFRPGPLSVLVMPSFEPELRVYVTQAFPVEQRGRPDPELEKPQVVLVRARRSIWHRLSTQLQNTPEQRLPELFAWPGLAASEVETASAPISLATVERLEQAWWAALRDLCPQDPGHLEPMLDGTWIEFSTPIWAGLARPPGAGTRLAALVALGEELAAFARADAKARPALEAKLLASAIALAARFEPKRSAGAR